jgi:hypothetical protein
MTVGGEDRGGQVHANGRGWPRHRLGVARNFCDKFDEEDKRCEQKEYKPEDAQAKKTQA